MNILALFQSKRSSELKSVAQSLVDDIAKRYPPELDNNPGKRLSVNRLTRIIEDVCNKAADFQTDKKLSWLGKSRFVNHFKWALTDMGYSKAFIDFATEAIVVRVTQSQIPKSR